MSDKIITVKCEIKLESGECIYEYLPFDEFLSHILRGISDSGYWNALKCDRLRLPEGLYNVGDTIGSK